MVEVLDWQHTTDRTVIERAVQGTHEGRTRRLSGRHRFYAVTAHALMPEAVERLHQLQGPLGAGADAGRHLRWPGPGLGHRK